MTSNDASQENFWRFLASPEPQVDSTSILLGQIILERENIMASQLRECLELQSKSRGGPRRKIGQILVERGLISPSSLESALVEQRKRLARFSPSPRYEIQERLGEGAAAVVFQAFDRDLARPVAIKIVKSFPATEDQSRQRLQREARAAARLAHPNVVAVHDVGVAGDRLFLIMERVQGESLNHRGLMEPRDAARLVEKTCRGLQHAHAVGIVHRDLKPANILVTPAGEPKIADFGLARLLDSDQALTAEGASVGTPLYMAPEQVNGKAATAQSDIHAIGAILYELLSGRTPFQSTDIPGLFQKIMFDEPAKLDSKIPRDLAVIAMKALEKDPSRRYATAGAMADDLLNYLEGRPVLARPAGTVRRWVRTASRHPIKIAAVLAAVVLAGIVGVILQAKSREREDTARRDADTKVKTDRKARALRLVEQGRTYLETAVQSLYRANTGMNKIFEGADEARGFFKQALDLEPGLAVAHFHLGRVQELKGHPEDAERSWRRTLDLDPGHGPAHYELGRLYLAQSRLAAIGTLGILEESLAESAKRLARRAQEEFNRSQDLGGGVRDELLRKVVQALLAEVSGDYASARRIADEGLLEFAGRDGCEEFHVIRYLSSNDPAERREFLDAALKIRPRFAMALFLRGETLEGEPAIADLTAAIEVNPQFGDAYSNRGSILYSLGRMAEAERDYNEAVTLSPGEPWPYHNRGNVRLALGNLQGAHQDFSEAVRINPSVAKSWINRGVTSDQLGHFQAAISDYTEGIRLAPDAESHTNRGLAYQRLGDLDRALADHERAVALNPNLLEALANRGLCHGLRKEYAESIRDLEKVLEMAPGDWVGREMALRNLEATKSRLNDGK